MSVPGVLVTPLMLLQLTPVEGGGAAESMSMVSLIVNSDLITKIVLVLLVVLSLLSWGIMFSKWRAFNVAEK
ncbi:MAG: hypothetical protein V4617_06450, partial [Gemmatimonadota bacterium]